MVSIKFFAKVFVTFAPLTSVVALYTTPLTLPHLLDASADELISGLEAGDFTSLDLVKVSIIRTHNLLQAHVLTRDRPT